MVYKCFYGLGPSYLNDILLKYEPSRTLRSSSAGLLVVPKVRTKTYGEASFCHYGPRLWNGLPESLRAKILLLVLIFILSHSLVIRQYHLVTTPLNWTDAQTYCRKNYIDLATIESPEEQETFLKTLNITNDRYEDLKNLFKVVWIGLQNEINWRWSDGFKGGITADNYWTSEDQYHSRSDQICLTTSKTNRFYPSQSRAW
uniref:C-type lectin domain-containing protein n=1 Tax=Oryzias latipes TaxID=8090 RepID=A0A3B3H567_ORYLA